jgi:SOS response regulatory protein OraA/RecX
MPTNRDPGEALPERSSRGRSRRHVSQAPLDADWLEKEAIASLARHEKSRAGLAQAVERALHRRVERTGEKPEGLLDALPQVLDRLEANGHLDDRRYAQLLLRRFESKGYPRTRVISELRAKGIAEDLARDCLRESDLDDDEADRRSAWRIARRNRIGPYCVDAEKRREHHERHLAFLGRRGFSFEIAHEIVDAREVPPFAERPESEDV